MVVRDTYSSWKDWRKMRVHNYQRKFMTGGFQLVDGEYATFVLEPPKTNGDWTITICDFPTTYRKRYV